MKYRDAKNLHTGDEVTRKEDEVVLQVSSVEVYGQYKKVRINCLEGGAIISLWHDEIS